MKRALALALAIGMMLVSLVGCSGKANSSVPAPSSELTASNVSIKDKYKGQQVVMYGRFMEADAKWLADTVWPEFEKEYGVKVIYKTFENPADLVDMLALDKGNNTATMFMVTDAVAPQLVDAGLVAPVSEYDVDGKYSELFTPESVENTKVNGTQYFMPYNVAVYMMLYLKTPVADAVKNWSSMKAEINASLKNVNGVGLPEGYELEENPSKWDNYDLAVVGYYWSKTNYNGTTAPRIAHRAKKYDGTITELVSKAYQLGASQEDVLKMDTEAVSEMFAWESYYADAGIYNPAMWGEGWGGGNIYQAFADGACYLAFMHVQDAFTIRGDGTPALPGYLADINDMALATSITGSSLKMDGSKPATTGVSSAVTWSWNWGVTADSPNKDLSFELMKYMTTGKPEYTARWFNAGLYVPLKDAETDPGKYIANDWQIDIYEVATEQLKTAKPVPPIAQFPAVGNVYLDAWYDIVVNKNNKDILATLTNVYAPQAAEVQK